MKKWRPAVTQKQYPARKDDAYTYESFVTVITPTDDDLKNAPAEVAAWVARLMVDGKVENFHETQIVENSKMRESGAVSVVIGAIFDAQALKLRRKMIEALDGEDG